VQFADMKSSKVLYSAAGSHLQELGSWRPLHSPCGCFLDTIGKILSISLVKDNLTVPHYQRQPLRITGTLTTSPLSLRPSIAFCGASRDEAVDL
jgi:hypothetical protein